MAVQQSFSFRDADDRCARLWSGGGNGTNAAITVVTGPMGLFGPAARRLERALAGSGLSEHRPRMVARVGSQTPRGGRRGSPPSGLAVALGAVAAAELLRRPVRLALERGRVRQSPDGHRVLMTEHPCAILRLSDQVARGRE